MCGGDYRGPFGHHLKSRGQNFDSKENSLLIDKHSWQGCDQLDLISD